MIIEIILDFIFDFFSGVDFDNLEFMGSILVLILPVFYKVSKTKLRKHYTLILGFIAYFLTMVLIKEYFYKSRTINENIICFGILLILCLIEIISSFKSKRFNEVYEVIEDYEFYKKLSVNIEKFNYDENDLEIIKFILRTNLNILSLYNKIGDLNLEIKNDKESIFVKFKIKFNKFAKGYEIENIISRYEELERINYIKGFKSNSIKDKIEFEVIENKN